MIPPDYRFACRYALTKSGWSDAASTVFYFVVEDMEVVWANEVPEILDCAAIDIVAVV